MFSLELQAGQEDRDLLIAELWEAGSSRILETSAACALFSRTTARLPGCATDSPPGW
jgi:hypothetical protein